MKLNKLFLILYVQNKLKYNEDTVCEQWCNKNTAIMLILNSIGIIIQVVWYFILSTKKLT